MRVGNGAYVTDSIERVFQTDEKDQSPEARLKYRLKWSLPVMTLLVKRLESIRAASFSHCCFRNIAMGRRNWLHSGSHIAAKNIAFMFGLLESCKLNNLNFGEYIEDILTRIVNEETVDIYFLPCNYSPRKAEDDAVA